MGGLFGGGGGGEENFNFVPAPYFSTEPVYNPYLGLAAEQGTPGASSLLGGAVGTPGAGTPSFVPTAGLGAQNFNYIPGAENLLRIGRSPVYSYF